MRVRNIDRIESRSQRRIDIRAGRIAHHPRLLRCNLQITHDMMIDRDVFFWHNDHLPEVPRDPRPLDLELLFFDISFRQQDKVMASRQIAERLLDSLK